jgi:uncharacterized membrane protein YhiD involved in acid resistance
MKNPFESGHIKNYLLAYFGALIIVILFFIASSLFYDIKKYPKKEFKTKKIEKTNIKTNIKTDTKKIKKQDSKIKLLDKGY